MFTRWTPSCTLLPSIRSNLRVTMFRSLLCESFLSVLWAIVIVVLFGVQLVVKVPTFLLLLSMKIRGIGMLEVTVTLLIMPCRCCSSGLCALTGISAVLSLCVIVVFFVCNWLTPNRDVNLTMVRASRAAVISVGLSWLSRSVAVVRPGLVLSVSMLRMRRLTVSMTVIIVSVNRFISSCDRWWVRLRVLKKLTDFFAVTAGNGDLGGVVGTSLVVMFCVRVWGRGCTLWLVESDSWCSVSGWAADSE